MANVTVWIPNGPSLRESLLSLANRTEDEDRYLAIRTVLARLRASPSEERVGVRLSVSMAQHLLAVLPAEATLDIQRAVEGAVQNEEQRTQRSHRATVRESREFLFPM